MQSENHQAAMALEISGESSGSSLLRTDARGSSLLSARASLRSDFRLERAALDEQLAANMELHELALRRLERRVANLRGYWEKLWRGKILPGEQSLDLDAPSEPQLGMLQCRKLTKRSAAVTGLSGQTLICGATRKLCIVCKDCVSC